MKTAWGKSDTLLQNNPSLLTPLWHNPIFLINKQLFVFHWKTTWKTRGVARLAHQLVDTHKNKNKKKKKKTACILFTYFS